MKKTIAAAFASLTLLVSAAAVAQSDHGEHKPQYGGVLTDLKGKQYELVTKPGSIVIYVEDHGKKVATKGATARLTLLNGREKTEVAMSPAGDNKLEAKGSFKAAPGTKAVAVVTLAGQPARSVRFALK